MEGTRLADLEAISRAFGLRSSFASPQEQQVIDCSSNLTVPYAFENTVKFLAISTGSAHRFESGRGPLEAVALGCAKLDLNNDRLKRLPPGPNGYNWVNEMCSYLYAIDGREASAKYTAEYTSSSVRRIKVRQLEKWLRTSVEPGTNGLRHTIIVCDDSAEIGRLLEQEGIRGRYDYNSSDLYNSTLTESETATSTHAEMYGRLGLPDLQYPSVRDRAERALQAILAIALKVANNSAPALGGATELSSHIATTQAQIASRPLPDSPKKLLVRLRRIARIIRASAANLAIRVVRFLGASPLSAHTPIFTDTVILRSEISTTQQGTIDETPRSIPIELARAVVQQTPPAQVHRWTRIRGPPDSVSHPVPRPEDYDDDNFTTEDDTDVSIDSATHEISDLPLRIDLRVKRYKDMTTTLVVWLKTVARHYDYSNLPACLTSDPNRLERISRFVELADFITTQVEIPLTVLQHIYEIIALRSFVMRWHQDLVAKKGFRDDGVIAMKTKGHQAFVRIMQRVYDDGWSVSFARSDGTDPEDQ
ncbi:hypothetical protein LTS10_003154 [Elasticomyces elasticus]|nr:hypothetical protein LTS10_003154 [Elasticomyces elasticus]